MTSNGVTLLGVHLLALRSQTGDPPDPYIAASPSGALSTFAGT